MYTVTFLTSEINILNSLSQSWFHYFFDLTSPKPCWNLIFLIPIAPKKTMICH